LLLHAADLKVGLIETGEWKRMAEVFQEGAPEGKDLTTRSITELPGRTYLFLYAADLKVGLIATGKGKGC
jgi:hypothetical protein